MYDVPTAIVIDDDKDTVDLFCDYLDLNEIKAVGCGYDGKMAVELYEKHKPDVVLLDLMMPEHDGFYALEKIRAQSPNAYVIVITAVLNDEIEKRLDQLKPNKIFIKPFEIESMMELAKEIKMLKK